MKQLFLSLRQWVGKKLECTEDFSRLEGLKIRNVDGSKYRFNRLKKALLLLPQHVIQRLIDEDMEIVYSSDVRPVNNGRNAGFFSPSEKLIYVWDSGWFHMTWQLITIIHEIGHFVDFAIGGNRFFSCIATDLHEIYEVEEKYYNRFHKENKEYFTNNIREYFAQSFAEYFMVPGFKEKCPETARYIEDLLEEIAF